MKGERKTQDARALPQAAANLFVKRKGVVLSGGEVEEQTIEIAEPPPPPPSSHLWLCCGELCLFPKH